MRMLTSRYLAVFVAITVCFWVAACSEGPPSNAERSASESGGEHGEPAEGAGEQGESREGSGEHGETTEGAGEHGGSEGSEGEGEHGEGGGHDSGEEGEESGVYIGADETWDATRRGARLILAFDPVTNTFLGTVENTTEETICAVRVEVHLSTGTELGPTERTDLAPGQTTDVGFTTGGEAFDTWTAHPELSPCGG